MFWEASLRDAAQAKASSYNQTGQLPSKIKETALLRFSVRVGGNWSIYQFEYSSDKGRSMQDGYVESTTNVFSLSQVQADIHVIINQDLGLGFFFILDSLFSYDTVIDEYQRSFNLFSLTNGYRCLLTSTQAGQLLFLEVSEFHDLPLLEKSNSGFRCGTL